MKMRRIAIIGIVAALACAPRAQAADYEVQNVFEDAVYGAGIGAIVGLGFALIGNQSAKGTMSYILTGTGVGIIAGTAYGVYVNTHAAAEIEDGKVRFALPTPRLERHGQDVALSADLVRARF